MLGQLIALGLQLCAHPLPELADSLLPYVPVDPAYLYAVLHDAGPLGEAAPGTSTDKLLGFQVLASLCMFFSGSLLPTHKVLILSRQLSGCVQICDDAPLRRHHGA